MGGHVASTAGAAVLLVDFGTRRRGAEPLFLSVHHGVPHLLRRSSDDASEAKFLGIVLGVSSCLKVSRGRDRARARWELQAAAEVMGPNYASKFGQATTSKVIDTPPTSVFGAYSRIWHDRLGYTMDQRSLLELSAGAGLIATAVAPTAKAAVPSKAPSCDFVNAPDARLFVRDWGSGRPVLFLSGWTLPSDFWAYQMVAVASQGMRAVAYDRRGHGRSSDSGRGYDHDTLARDLGAVIDELDLDRVTLVGHSMAGTEIARYFARHGGRRVERVVLVGTITPFLAKAADNPAGLDREVLAALRAPLLRDFPGWIEENAAPFFVPETSREMIDWGKALMLQTSLLAAFELARANAETDFRPDLHKINVPVLVIHGDKDASAPMALTAQPTADLIPGARLIVYEGAPHGLPLTHIERLNRDLVAFVAEDR